MRGMTPSAIHMLREVISGVQSPAITTAVPIESDAGTGAIQRETSRHCAAPASDRNDVSADDGEGLEGLSAYRSRNASSASMRAGLTR